MTERVCGARRSGRGDRECTDAAVFEVVVSTPDGRELSRVPACFAHGLAECDRAAAAGGTAVTELVGPLGAPYAVGDESVG